MKIYILLILLTFITLAEIKDKELKLTSENLSYKGNFIVLNQNVVAKSKNFTITAEKLTGFIEEKTGKLQRIELTKNVTFSAQDYKAFCQYAIYLPQQNILTLLNNPKITKENSLLQAKKIIIHQQDKKILLFQSKITFYKENLK